MRTSQSSLAHDSHPGHGGVYIVRGDQLSDDDRTLLHGVRPRGAAEPAGAPCRPGDPSRSARPDRATRSPPPKPSTTVSETVIPRLELEFFNGLGGFADGGREYVTILGPGQSTPAPWLNVIANTSFGFLVSESGSGYTWSGNSRENQLTPWSNDPVSDPVSEAIYVRDDDTGELWGPTALPIRREGSTYVARHGAGYSRFEHLHDGIQLDLVQFVALDDPLKLSVLTIENRSGRTRRLSVTAYAEWALGTSRGASARADRHRPRPGDAGAARAQPVEHRVHRPGGVLRPRRPADGVDRRSHRVPRSQRRAGRPAGLDRGFRLRGAVGAGMDPCTALADQFRARRRSGDPGSGAARRSGHRGRGHRADPAWPRRRPRSRAARPGELLGRHPGDDPGAHARPLDGHHAQPLADLSDARLPAVGEVRVLPGRRRVRIPRPAPRRHRPGDRQARARPRAPAAGRRPSVRRRRRPALVAPALGTWRANPVLGRSRVAAVRGRSLPRRHG